MSNKVFFSQNNIHIEDSWEFTRKEFLSALNDLENVITSDVFKRSRWSLECEWRVHKALYKLGLFVSHTKDVDLNYPCPAEGLYIIIGTLLYPFVK